MIRTKHSFGLLFLTAALSFAVPAAAQFAEPRLIKTLDGGKDLPQLAAWSPDGLLLAYGTERELTPRRFRGDPADMPRFYPAEVWLVDMAKLDKKPKRLLDYREIRALNYRIDRLEWSPNGEMLSAEMTHRRLGTAIFFFNQKGKLARLGGNKRLNFVMGYGGGWMADSLNYGLLEEAYPPRLLHQVRLLRVGGGRVLSRFTKYYFAAVAWLPGKQQIVAIKRDRDFADTPKLVLGTLSDGTLEEVGDADDYQGRLAASPDETRISYFTAFDTLSVKSIESGETVARVPVPMGAYKWSPNGDAIYFLNTEEIGDTIGELTRVDLATGKSSEVLVEKLYDFWLSPDASHVAVLTAGRDTVLKIYQLR